MEAPTKLLASVSPPSTPSEESNKQGAYSAPGGQQPQIPSLATDNSQGPVQSNETMAPRSSQRGGGRSSNNHRRDADLSTIISATQKSELVLLAASIMNTMQEHVCKVFDQQTPRPGCQPTMSPLNNTGMKQPVLVTIACNTTESHNRAYVVEPDGAQGELKKEALAAFHKWQMVLTKRISEIHTAGDQVQQATAVQAKSFSGRQSGRAPGRGAGGPNNGRASSNDSRLVSNGDVAQFGGPVAVPGIPAVPIIQMTADKRHLLLHAMILLALSLETYQAYSRIFISRLAGHLRIPQHVVAEEEFRIANGLSYAASNAYTDEGIFKKSDEGRRDRRGRAAGPGGPTTGLTLAHSLDAAGVGSLTGGSGLGSPATATILGTMGTLSDGGLAVCVFFGMCGPRGSATKSLETFTKDVQDMALLPLHGVQRLPLSEGHVVGPGERRLRLTIGINGWLSSDEDAGNPWRMIGDRSEAYALNWEHETLEKIGASIRTIASSVAWQNAKNNFEHRNVLERLETFVWPNSLLKISKIVDNPWSVGMVRADKAGIALADAIINKIYGERSVSLIGYGLGARVIYTCLMSLSERRVFGQVENVLVMGTPAPSSQCVWTALRSVVSGRVVNVFSGNDFILGFLHRTGCVQFGVAGLQRIQGVYGIENVDASKPITNHLRYASLVGRILKDVGWEDLDLGEANNADESKPANHNSGPNTRTPTGQIIIGPSVAQAAAKEGKRKGGRRRVDAPVLAMGNGR